MPDQRTDRRVQVTRRMLREALLSLMEEKPVGKITPTELCRRADVNRNTFYAHYTSPGQLLQEIEDELYDQIIGPLSASPETTLHLTEICTAIRQRGNVCSVILSDYGDRDFLYRLITSVYDITIAEWRTLAPQASIQEMESVFTYCANGSVALVRKWVTEGMQTPPREVAKLLETTNRAVLMTLCRQ